MLSYFRSAPRPRARRRSAAAPSMALEGRVLLAGVAGDPPDGKVDPNDFFEEPTGIGFNIPLPQTEGPEGCIEMPPEGGTAGVPGGRPVQALTPDGAVTTRNPNANVPLPPGSVTADPAETVQIDPNAPTELEELESIAVSIEEGANQIGEAIRNGSVSPGGTTTAVLGSLAGSVVEAVGSGIAGLVNTPNGVIDTAEGAVETYHEHGGGLNGTALAAGGVLGTNGIGEAIEGHTLEGEPLTPMERLQRGAEGTATAAGTFALRPRPAGRLGNGSGGNAPGGGSHSGAPSGAPSGGGTHSTHNTLEGGTSVPGDGSSHHTLEGADPDPPGGPYEPVDTFGGGTGGAETGGVETNVPTSGRKFNQIERRGWTRESIDTTVKDPHTTREAHNRATGNPATAYFNKDGSHVIRDDVTGDLVQLSDRNDPGSWTPDPSIENPYTPGRSE